MTNKRIVLTAYGSFGDIHPYMAIALELQTRGHRAVIATSELYRYKIEAEGIGFHPVRYDSAIDMQQDGEFIGVLSESRRESEYTICYLLMPHLRATYKALLEAVQDADLLLTHHLSFAGSLIAAKTGIPWVSTVLSPLLFMSAYDSQTLSTTTISPYEQALAVVANDARLRQFRWQARLWSAPIRQLRGELGLPPSCDPVFEGQHSPDLVLALFSSKLAKPQPDWCPQTQVTGFPFYDRAQHEQLSPELARFLDAGSPPIVFTLGSLMVWTPGNFYLEGAIAAQQLGYRAILLVGKGVHNLPLNQLPEGVIVVDYAPHSEIFPRAAVIVHHGGVGTTGQALRSGRPMLVIPYAHDQPDNAMRLVRLGVARTLARHEYSANTLTAELKQLLFEPSYGIKAAEVGKRVQQEDGVKVASDAIETYLRSQENGQSKS